MRICKKWHAVCGEGYAAKSTGFANRSLLRPPKRSEGGGGGWAQALPAKVGGEGWAQGEKNPGEFHQPGLKGDPEFAKGTDYCLTSALLKICLTRSSSA